MAGNIAASPPFFPKFFLFPTQLFEAQWAASFAFLFSLYVRVEGENETKRETMKVCLNLFPTSLFFFLTLMARTERGKLPFDTLSLIPLFTSYGEDGSLETITISLSLFHFMS